jgi:hypothetical protein
MALLHVANDKMEVNRESEDCGHLQGAEAFDRCGEVRALSKDGLGPNAHNSPNVHRTRLRLPAACLDPTAQSKASRPRKS